MYKLIYNKIKNINSDTITLWMNYLFVTYAFLIPVSHRAKSSILAVIILLFIIRGNYTHYLKEILKNKVIQAFIIFFTMYFLWLFGTENITHAKSMISEVKVILFSILFLSFIDKKFSFKILIALLAGILYSELFSFGIFTEFIPAQLQIFNYKLYESSIIDPSPFLSHGRYSIFLSLALSLSIYFVINNYIKNKFYLILVILFICMTAINISIIGGRIGYISTFLSILFVIILKYKKQFLKPLLFTLLFLSIFFTISYQNSQLFKSRIDQSVSSINKIQENNDSSYDSSIGLRVGFWLYSTNIIMDNLLFGVGTGDQMDEVKNSIDNEHNYISNLSHPHNEYINILLQFGIIGLIIFLNIFYQIFKFKQDENMKDIMLITSFVVLVSLTSSIMNGKYFLTLFVVITSAMMAQKEYFTTDNLLSTKKELSIYSLFLTASLFISILQQ